mmetsp:Transcript_39/g.96  ORF Transcript_39/g.96 Transcript_39/m.96 type:complete len:161 (-) Transcript_39:462-944(-)
MSLPPRGQHNEQQQAFLRQATILRKNLNEWEATICSAQGEDWPSMLGRLNAAFNQAGNLDAGIEDASEHFVYVPKKCTMNAQDMAFFLSTRLATAAGGDNNNMKKNNNSTPGGAHEDGSSSSSSSKRQYYGGEAPAKRLRLYESQIDELASEFENGIVRF